MYKTVTFSTTTITILAASTDSCFKHKLFQSLRHTRYMIAIVKLRNFTQHIKDHCPTCKESTIILI